MTCRGHLQQKAFRIEVYRNYALCFECFFCYKNVQILGEMNMNEKKIKCKAIFSQKLAGYLLMRGFVLAESRKDYKNPEKNLFFFFESPELMEAITDYTNKQER